MEFIQSNKGKPNLCYEGFMYTRKTKSKSTIRWECTKQREDDCPGKLSTNIEETAVISGSKIAHNPREDNFEMAATKVRKEIQRNTSTFRRRTPMQILTDVVTAQLTEVRLALGDTESMKRSIRRAKKGVTPAEPSTLQDLHIPDEWQTTGGNDRLRFLIYDSGENPERILVFATDTSLRVLSESEVWYMDGTFSSAPHLFKQLYIIRAPYGDSCVTCVYALLPGKMQSIYEELLTAVLNKSEELGLSPDPLWVTLDFEQAMMNAVSATLGCHVQVHGCFYHLTQATWRKMQELGLSVRYREEEDLKHFCGMLDGLAFLPMDDVPEGMDFIRHQSLQDSLR